MDALKVTYVICHAVCSMFFISLAVFAPIYATEGKYYWSMFLVLIVFLDSLAFSGRMNKWTGKI